MTYPVMAEPPVLDGAFQVSFTEPLPAVGVTAVGGPGTLRGVTMLETGEGEPVPIELVAATVKV